MFLKMYFFKFSFNKMGNLFRAKKKSSSKSEVRPSNSQGSPLGASSGPSGPKGPTRPSGPPGNQIQQGPEGPQSQRDRNRGIAGSGASGASGPVTPRVVNLSTECVNQINSYKNKYGRTSNPLWENTGIKCYPSFQSGDGYKDASSCLGGKPTCGIYDCPYVRDPRHQQPEWDLSACVTSIANEKFEQPSNSLVYSSLNKTWKTQDKYNL